MTLIALITAVATLLWTFAVLGFIEWFWTVARTERPQHVAHMADLLGNLVPAMIALVVVVMVGAFIGLPSVVVIIALLFPAGLAFGVQMALNDLRGTAWPWEAGRIALVVLIGGAIIWYGQVA